MRPSDFPREDAPHVSESRQPGFAQATIEHLFEFSPDGILVTDGQGIIREVNPRVEELFGYGKDELIGQPIEILVPPRFRGRHPQHRENYSAHPRARQMGAAMNLWGLRKDGTEFPVDIMLKPIAAEEDSAVLSFIRDATEQRNAQEQLRATDARLRSIVESVSEYAIYLLDAEGHVMTCTGLERRGSAAGDRRALPGFTHARADRRIHRRLARDRYPHALDLQEPPAGCPARLHHHDSQPHGA